MKDYLTFLGFDEILIKLAMFSFSLQNNISIWTNK